MESKNVLSEVKEQLTNVNPFQPGAPTGMQRDNDSIDDFEHLEPESSPAKETVGSISHGILDSKLVDLDSGPILTKLTEKKDDLECSLSSHPKTDPFDLKGDFKNKLPENRVDTSSQFLDFADTAKPIDTASLSKSDIVDPIVNSSKDFLAQFEKSGTEFLGEVKELSPFSKFDSPLNSHSGGQNSSLAFMEAERGGLFDKPIGLPPKENKADTVFDDLESLKFESEPAKDVFPEKHIGTEIIKEKDPSPTPKPDLYTSSIKDQYDIDEDFPSSDKLPQASKEKISEKSETIFHDFHDEDKDLDSLELQDEALKVDPIKYGDKEIVKPPVELPLKISPGPNTKPVPSAPELDLGFKSSPPAPLPTVTPLPAAPQAKPKTVSKNEPNTKIEQISKKTKLDVELIGEPLDLGAWFNPDRLHPKVVELVYWRDPKKSGIVFGSVLGVLLSLSYFSLISVVAYLSLFVLAGTVAFRIYKNVLQAVQKTSDGHPFKDILDLDLTLPQDKVREVTDLTVSHINGAAVELRRLFLVEDLVDSIKFGVLLWCLTYLGAWFNGMTLVIISFVALFTLPKVYEQNKAQIDQYLDIAKSKFADISSKVRAAIPIGKKPPVEEKKEQ